MFSSLVAMSFLPRKGDFVWTNLIIPTNRLSFLLVSTHIPVSTFSWKRFYSTSTVNNFKYWFHKTLLIKVRHGSCIAFSAVSNSIQLSVAEMWLLIQTWNLCLANSELILSVENVLDMADKGTEPTKDFSFKKNHLQIEREGEGWQIVFFQKISTPFHGRFFKLNPPIPRNFHFSVILSLKKLGFWNPPPLLTFLGVGM